MDEVQGKQYRETAADIDFVGILIDVIRGWWLIAMAVAVAAMGSYVWNTSRYTPTYSTSATMLVTNKSGVATASYNISAAYQMAEVFRNITDSEPLKRRVREDLESDSIPGTITTTLVDQTNMLRIDVTAGSPRDAFLIIRSVIKNAPELAATVMETASVQILKAPYLPSSVDNPLDLRAAVKKAGMFGGAAAIALLAILSYMKDTVKSEHDIKRRVNAPLLGTVYKEKKKGLRGRFGGKNKGLLFNKFTISFAFTESIKKIRSRVEYAAKANDGKVIMVTSVMENEGKTTMAANLAISLAEKGKKVLLVDGDMRKPALHKLLEQPVSEEQQFGYVLQRKKKVNDALIHSKSNHILMLLGTKSYEHSAEMIGSGQFGEIIDKAKELVDYVVIDSPPLAYLSDAEAMSGCADGVVLTIRQNQCKIEQINDALDGLSQGKAKIYGCIFNQVRRGGAAGFGYKYGYGYGSSYESSYDRDTKR